MIPVDLSANCEGWIYDPNGSGNQILGIRSRDPFSGSTDMSGCNKYSACCFSVTAGPIALKFGMHLRAH